MMQTLRSDAFFGKYGAIRKVWLRTCSRAPAPRPICRAAADRCHARVSCKRCPHAELAAVCVASAVSCIPPSSALRRQLPSRGARVEIVSARLQVSITHGNGSGANARQAGAAYVIFEHEPDAHACICDMDNQSFHGKVVRACFGTTKYCHTFLKGGVCTNSECQYLHHLGARPHLTAL